MNRTFGFVVALVAWMLMATPPVYAAAGFTNCNLAVLTRTPTIGPGNRACYEFANSDGATESGMFQVTAISMLVTFDPDTDASGVPASAAVIDLMHCPACDKAATGANTCEPNRALAGTGLTGLAGTSDTQNRSVRVGPGCYYIDVTTEAPAGDDALVSLQGE